ncbi:unnamed protein product, partial [Gulo gulo]
EPRARAPWGGARPAGVPAPGCPGALVGPLPGLSSPAVRFLRRRGLDLAPGMGIPLPCLRGKWQPADGVGAPLGHREGPVPRGGMCGPGTEPGAGSPGLAWS